MEVGVLAAELVWRVCAEGKPCCLRFHLHSSPFCLWAAHDRILLGSKFQVGSFFFNSFCFSGDDPFPRSIFSVLGRSQQQGKTTTKTKQTIVQFSLWKDVVQSGWPGMLHLGQGCRTRGLGVPCSFQAAAGGWLRRASSGWCRGSRWSRVRRGGGGPAPRPGPCHSVDSRDESRMSS